MKNCRCPVFAQSRSLEHTVSSAWRDELFDRLAHRPVDTIYSIAFYISFLPTHGISDESDESKLMFFTVTRELFDLLDDHVRDTDALETEELQRDRCVTFEAFVAANADYVSRARRFDDMLDRYYAVEPTSDSSIRPEDRAEMLRLFDELNELAQLPMIVNPNGTMVAKRFDVESLTRASDYALLHSPYDSLLATTTSSSNGDGGDAAVSIATTVALEAFDIGDGGASAAAAKRDGARFARTIAMPAWTPMQLYLRYAYSLARHRSFEPIVLEISRSRGVEIAPIIVPMGSAWQCGTSQMLWIVLHTLCALSVSRSNVYLERLLVLLKNVSFFVWCGDCSQHWLLSGGSDYFDQFLRLSRQARSRLPIDVILARCHNSVSANGRTNGHLRAWTLAQLVIDYREFSERALLRRRPALCDRFECIGCAEDGASSSSNLAVRRSCFMRPFYTAENTLSFSSDDILRVAKGEWLLAKLWFAIDREVPIGSL